MKPTNIPPAPNGPAVVLFSGGQDSTTALSAAVEHYGSDEVCAVSFEYGQRHAVELECAERICGQLGVPHLLFPLPDLSTLVDSALTSEGAVAAPHPSKAGLPASFVPGRNALLLTLAHAYAQTVQANTIWAGMCETDFSGYPDCRRSFVDCLETALNVGYQTDIAIYTPLMHIDKAQTWKWAFELGEDTMSLVVQESHTCYEGDRAMKHEWGFGCGVCPACDLRQKGWLEFVEWLGTTGAGAKDCVTWVRNINRA